ncbi:MAG: MBL fold metallo-hydrolase [Candidatus Promineifilaceae bacterium]|nr:MBL fold metallo-hydrolase [Candidatus Promineifilaceae bacterium]
MKLTVHILALRLSTAYLIETPTDLYLVDAGSPGEGGAIMERIAAIESKSLRLIFLTHAHLDHYGGAADVRRVTGAPVAIHSADAQALAAGQTDIGLARGRGRLLRTIFPWLQFLLRPEPVEADLMVEDWDSFAHLGLPAEVVHLPGHTAGSSALLVQELCFAGDLLTNRRRPQRQRFFAQDWSQLASSLTRLRALRPTLIYPGHGTSAIADAELQKLPRDVR